MLKAAGRVAAVLLALSASVAPADAQIVKGRVVLSGTEKPLADVSVRMRAADGRILGSTMTSPDGEFRLHAARIMPVTLVAERIGMQTVTTQELQLTLSEVIDVEIAMAETAVPLDPLTVRAREYTDIGPLSGYYERVQRHERMGFGHVLTRDQVIERDALDVADLLREVPRISVVNSRERGSHVLFRGGTGQCTPKVYLNGLFANRNMLAYLNEFVHPSDLEGIEVYRGIGEMPGEFYDETHCGVILLWTRRDTQGGRPMAWKRVVVTLAGIAAFSLLLLR